MSRPEFERIEFGDGLDLAVIEFVARETPNSFPDLKSVTGTIRVRASANAWR